MNEHPDALPNEGSSDLVEWKAAQHRKDEEDIAAGRRTAGEVQRENAGLIPDPTQTTIQNEYAACEAL